MMARALLLAALLLTACSPAVYYVTPGAVLPVEAGRIVDAATATAAAAASQAALATATGISARETATAGRQATLDALAARQTEVSLSLTQQAGQGAATATTAARTQSAGASQAWATPTAAAMRTQAAAAATDRARQQEAAASVAEFWRTLRTVLVALLIVAGLTAITVVAIDRITALRVARLREQAAIAREAFRLLPPGHWAEWEPASGYQVYQLPGPLDEPAVIIENATGTPSRDHAWRQAVRLFAWWGDRYGFGLRELGPAGAGVVTDPAWRVLARLLKDAGVLVELAMGGRKGRVTAWAPGWSFQRLADEMSHGQLQLPYPKGDAPKVAFAVPTQHHN